MELISIIFNILLESDDSDVTPLLFLLLGPLSGLGFYWYIYLRYRNTDKRFIYESETENEIANVGGTDEYVRENNGTEDPNISGQNDDDHTERLGVGSRVISNLD